MDGETPDLERPPTSDAPTDRTIGRSGTPVALLGGVPIVLAVVIIGLVLTGGWIAFAIAIVLMVGGVIVLARVIRGATLDRASRKNLSQGLHGVSDDFAITDDAHEDILPQDLPPGETRREVEHRIADAEKDLSPSQEPEVPTYKP